LHQPDAMYKSFDMKTVQGEHKAYRFGKKFCGLLVFNDMPVRSIPIRS